MPPPPLPTGRFAQREMGKKGAPLLLPQSRDPEARHDHIVDRLKPTGVAALADLGFPASATRARTRWTGDGWAARLRMASSFCAAAAMVVSMAATSPSQP